MHKTALLVILLAAGCLAAPKKNYTPAEIQTLESLEELMRVNASKADPLFAKSDQGSFTDTEYASMTDAGTTIEATGKRAAERFGGQGEYDDGFVDYANQLSGFGKALADAAAAKDAAAASQALEAMRNTCKSCHGVYR